MFTIWTDHLPDQEEKTKFKEDVYGAHKVIDRIRTILEGRLKSIERSEVSLTVYDSPSWSAKQAHNNGRRSEIMDFLTLIDLDQQKELERGQTVRNK